MLTNQIISKYDRVIQGKGNIVTDMGGEKVMLSVKNGKYYNLGESGGEIWSLMKEPIEVKQIINSLISCYQVEQEECEKQVLDFINHLISHELVEINNSPCK